MPRLTLHQRKARNGYLYILPWLIGMITIFIPAFYICISYCFCKVDGSSFETTFNGIGHFYKAFREDAEFPQLLAETLLTNLKDVPLILIFSYFVALLLKKPFRGIALVKGIFFMTVILSSDVFLTMEAELGYLDSAYLANTIENAPEQLKALDGSAFTEYLLSFGVGEEVIGFLSQAVQSISDIFNKSGVQIFIFLAGLSSIPDSMYEAASMEGATEWESFWKITFPMTTSIIVVNFVYTMVDTFNTMMSPMMQYIYTNGLKGGNYGYGSAMSAIYFVIIGVIMGVLLLLTRKRVFYYV